MSGRPAVSLPLDPVRLERPAPARAAEFLAAVRRSRTLHRSWVHPPGNLAEYAAFVRRARGRNTACFLVVAGPERRLAGVINLSEIVRGAFQSAYLGYYAFAPFAGRGVMSRGLALVLDRAFGRLGLHRLEANLQPGNAASRRLVERLGFAREGYSPRYLKIAGRWRDHERWAILAEQWPGRTGPPRTDGRRPGPLSRAGGAGDGPARAGRGRR